MTIDDLSLWHTFCVTKRFSKTANAHNVSEDRVTEAIIALEKMCRLEIVNRNRKHIIISEFGQILDEFAQVLTRQEGSLN
jgi:DNA-binding transcriptional LysR family regulator